ncbi:MAG: hypothetical protein MRY74_05725 [Neomegalonema sp.]|nr:hypothetical protein [Neomegalonema sp.]
MTFDKDASANNAAHALSSGALGRRLFLVGGAMSMLAGCVSGARSTALTARPTAKSLVKSDELIYRTIGVGAVGGGKETDIVSGSQISSGNFRQALESSLDLTGLLAKSSPRFLLDATIEQIDQEIFDINLDVKTTVYYRLRSVASGAFLYERRVTETYEARFTESFIRSERFRIANEGSGRKNIASFIDRFVADFRTNPYKILRG